MENVKISIIIPVYNSEKYLSECLESVVNQTFKDIEIICVNDGSTDSSQKILEAFQAKDSRIKIINQANSGAGKARNVGIENACGEYLYFLDSDDWLELNALEKFANSIGDADICLCRCQYYDDVTKEFKKTTNKKAQKTDNIFKIHPIPLFTKLYRTSFIRENNIKCQEIKTGNDVYFNYAALILASSIKSIADALVIHRESRDGSLTSSRGKSAYCILKAFYELKKLVPNKLKNKFYKRAFRCFKYELQFCDELQKADLEILMNEFLPHKYRIGKLFDFRKDCTHIIFTIFGLKIKIKSQKCPPPEKIELLLKNWYFEKTGNILDLNNPKTFNEKIQWLKLYDSTPLKTRLADKYLVRDWVKEKIGEQYLIPLLGVWDKYDDIDFDKLPDQFVLKCNHGSGYNIIVDDKSKFNKKEARKKINKWMKENFAYKAGFELHYSGIPRKIIAEEYVDDIANGSNSDYHFFCFNGMPKLFYLTNRKGLAERTWSFFDMDLNALPVYKNNYEPARIEENKNFNKITEIVNILCKDFKFVRVDIYYFNNKIYFGEMTFTPSSGIAEYSPKSWEKDFGDMLKLPIPKQQTI